LPARRTFELEDRALARAIEGHQEAVLLFEGDDPTRPLIIGLLQPETPRIHVVPDIEARVDGKRVVIEGREEVMLRCGPATLTLRKDGTVVLRGVNIVTRAERVQRIRGGKVQIN
jgi:hypothetical protein